MTSRDEQDVWKGGTRPASPHSRAFRIGRSALFASVEPWGWLEELRLRFDLAFEILDTDLQFVLTGVPHRDRGTDIRAMLDRDPVLGEAALSTLRSGRARSITVAALRLRLLPLYGLPGSPRAISGILVLADSLDAAAAANEDPVDAIDRRLESTGQWLAAAIEAGIKTATADAAESHRAERLEAMIEIAAALEEMDDDRPMIQLIVEAVALWFDADVRVYRLSAYGSFVLDKWLPGARQGDTPSEIPATAVWGHDDVFPAEALHDVEALNWPPRLADALLAPILLDDSPEWLLMVFGAGDPSLRAILAFLGRSAGLCLTRQAHAARVHMCRTIGQVLTMGDPPFDATVRLALESAALEIGATAARVALYHRESDTPALVIGWGRADRERPAFVEPGGVATTAHEIAVGTRVAAGLSIVLEFHRLDSELPTSAARLAPVVADALAGWLAGLCLRHGGELPAPSSPAHGADLVNAIDRACRARVAGAVAAVLLDRKPASESEVGEFVRTLENQVRASDVVGLVADRGVGVLLSEVTPAHALDVAERLRRAATERFNVTGTAGVATIGTSSESANAVIARALSSARRGEASPLQ